MSEPTGKIIMSADIASALDWPVWKAKYWLRTSGAGRKVGRRWVTSPEKLREFFPEMLEAMLHKLPATDRDDSSSECEECEELRAALLEKDRQIDELCRRMGTNAAAFRRTRTNVGAY